MKLRVAVLTALTVVLLAGSTRPGAGQTIAVRGETVHTLAGPAINDGIVLVRDGKITAVGPAASVKVPDGVRVLRARVVTPGLIDARSALGLAGFYNQAHDRDEVERSQPSQPELRAVDAFNPLDPLLEWVRGFGITTAHTGHAPEELIPGQTMIVKTQGAPVDRVLVKDLAAVAVSLTGGALKREQGKSPGTRAKSAALLRADLVKAREYVADPPKARDLRLEVLGRVLKQEVPLLVTAQRAQDIATALRLAREFDVRLILEGAAEAYLMLDEIAAARVPVIVHPPLARAWGDLENASRETPLALLKAGIPFAFGGGYEDYVPRARVVLFEAGAAVAAGLPAEQALAAITREPATILGIADRVGSLAPGKDGDIALFDGDPFEYTTHCTGTVIEGRLVSEVTR